MSLSKQRVARLTTPQKREFLEVHLPNRIRIIEEAMRRRPRSYYHFSVAAVHSRALAQFLGLRLTSQGRLAQYKEYFAHEGKDSYEVKIVDVSNLPFLNPTSLSDVDRKTLEDGFDTVNREILHLTYWPTRARHHVSDQPGQDYIQNLLARLERFCLVILRETRHHLQKATI